MGRLALLAGAMAMAFAACSQGSPAPPAAHGWTMVAQTRVGATPGPVVLGGQWAFVANMSDGTVSQMRRSDGRVVATIKVADPRVLRDQACAPDSVHNFYSGSWGWRQCDTPYAIAWDGTALWALDNGTSTLWRIDPDRHTVNDKLRLPGTGWSVTIYDGIAYVTGFADPNAIYVADLKTHEVTTVDNLDDGAATLVADSTGVWIDCVRAPTGHLDHFDPARKEITGRYPIEWWSEAITSDSGGIYVRGTFGGDISRIDPATGAIRWTAPGPSFIGRQGIDEMGPVVNGIWMSGPYTALIDLATGAVDARIAMPSTSVAAAGREVWLIELNGTVAKFVLT